MDHEQVQYFIDKGCKRRCVTCKAGDMVLWDSRLKHCGREPTKGRENQNIRCVAYICMTPRSRASDINLKKKQKAFNELRLTAHWPHKPMLFAIQPRFYGNPIAVVRDIVPPVVNDIGRRLAGFD